MSIRVKELQEAHERIIELEAENARLREALEFYADERNWDEVWWESPADDDESGDVFMKIDESDLQWDFGIDKKDQCPVAGKRARQALNRDGGSDAQE